MFLNHINELRTFSTWHLTSGSIPQSLQKSPDRFFTRSVSSLLFGSRDSSSMRVITGNFVFFMFMLIPIRLLWIPTGFEGQSCCLQNVAWEDNNHGTFSFNKTIIVVKVVFIVLIHCDSYLIKITSFSLFFYKLYQIAQIYTKVIKKGQELYKLTLIDVTVLDIEPRIGW